MFCHVCNADRHPIQDMLADLRVISRCPECQTPVDADEMEAPPFVAPATAAAPAPKAPQKVASTPDALAIVDTLRERLTFCEAEIAKREQYLAEREMLRRMIDAAEAATATAAPPTKCAPLN